VPFPQSSVFGHFVSCSLLARALAQAGMSDHSGDEEVSAEDETPDDLDEPVPEKRTVKLPKKFTFSSEKKKRKRKDSEKMHKNGGNVASPYIPQGHRSEKKSKNPAADKTAAQAPLETPATKKPKKKEVR
jgi:hypothetical protein